MGKLEGFQDIRNNTRGKLLVNLYDKLVPALESSIREFTKLMKMFETLRQRVSRIQTFVESLRGSTDGTQVLEDIVGYLDLVVMNANNVLNMYESEFLVKITIFKDLEEGGVDIGVVSNYLTVWTAEPNISPHSLDRLLKELDEHLDLLRDLFAGKSGPDLNVFSHKLFTS